MEQRGRVGLCSQAGPGPERLGGLGDCFPWEATPELSLAGRSDGEGPEPGAWPWGPSPELGHVAGLPLPSPRPQPHGWPAGPRLLGTTEGRRPGWPTVLPGGSAPYEDSYRRLPLRVAFPGGCGDTKRPSTLILWQDNGPCTLRSPSPTPGLPIVPDPPGAGWQWPGSQHSPSRARLAPPPPLQPPRLRARFGERQPFTPRSTPHRLTPAHSHWDFRSSPALF